MEGNLVRVQDEDGHSTMVHHEPKTQAGYRTVPVLSEFVHVVREHVDTNKSARASVPSLLHPLGHRPLKPMALFVTG